MASHSHSRVSTSISYLGISDLQLDEVKVDSLNRPEASLQQLKFCMGERHKSLIMWSGCLPALPGCLLFPRRTLITLYFHCTS